MAYIKEISFARVGRKEGCLCDRCGTYIQNIVSVEFSDGLSLRLGQDCFKNLYDHSSLTDYGKKLFRKALKYKEAHDRQYEAYISGQMTAENDESWKVFEMPNNKGCYWAVHHEDYEAYRQWMITEVLPQRFKEDKERMDRFAKVNFKL